MNNDIKVLHCAETIKGGIASYLNSLISIQMKTKDKFKIILLLPFSQKSESVEISDIDYFYYKDSSNRIINSFMIAFRTIQLISKYSPNIIHIHSFFAGLILRPALIFYKKIKIIYCPHGWSFDRKSSFLSQQISVMIEFLLSHINQKIICISDHEKAIAIKNKIVKKNLITIKNAIDIEAFQKQATKSDIWPKQKLKLLFIGRFDHQKGLDIFINSLKNLQDEAHAVLIGSGVLGDEGDLKKEIMKSKNITLVGWKNQKELIEYYSNADLIVIPSRWEGFGLVAIEAMSCGLPVVASDVGGLSEIVLENVTGKLFKSESSSELLKILKTLSTDDIKRMSINSLGRVKNFYNIIRLNNEITNLYNKIIDEN